MSETPQKVLSRSSIWGSLPFKRIVRSTSAKKFRELTTRRSNDRIIAGGFSKGETRLIFKTMQKPFLDNTKEWLFKIMKKLNVYQKIWLYQEKAQPIGAALNAWSGPNLDTWLRVRCSASWANRTYLVVCNSLYSLALIYKAIRKRIWKIRIRELNFI